VTHHIIRPEREQQASVAMAPMADRRTTARTAATAIRHRASLTTTRRIRAKDFQTNQAEVAMATRKLSKSAKQPNTNEIPFSFLDALLRVRHELFRAELLVLLRRSSLRADDGQKVGSFRSLAKKRVEEFAAAIPV
jgi:hypothetical protein